MISKDVLLTIVIDNVLKEIKKQDEKYSNQLDKNKIYSALTYDQWKAILDEEYAEVHTEILVHDKDGVKELTQVAAVVFQWMIAKLSKRTTLDKE